MTRWTQKVGSRTFLGPLLGDPFGSQVGFRTGPWIKKDAQNTASLQASFSKEILFLSKILGEAKTVIPLEKGFKIQVFRNFVFGRLPGPVWDKF